MALGTRAVAKADEAMVEVTATGEEETATDEGEAEVGLGFALPSVSPMPAHRNATELNSTRARHWLSKVSILESEVKAGPNPSLLQSSP